jgi:pyruvate dehydrogenase E2 component (dihydrolipoamide acetyltransferase)
MAESVTMPKLGFDMAEGKLVRWVKAEGEAVVKGNVLAEIETDKATVEVESSFSGVVARHLVEEGATVPVGTPIAILAAAGEKVEDVTAAAGGKKEIKPAAAVEKAAQAVQPEAAGAAVVEGGRVKASPLAKRMARQQKVDLAAVRGSGPGGRITRKDIETALIARPGVAAVPVPFTPAETASTMPETASTQAAVEPGAEDERVEMNRLRAAIGRRMLESKQQVPHFYVTHEYHMDGLMAARSEINTLLPDEQKLSVNDFIIKGTALALKRFPGLNSSLQGSSILRHAAVNVGVAVAVTGGLLTIVVHHADQKALRVISEEVKAMAVRVRDGKVRPEDIEGSTFSISNLGMFDVEHFVAIINPPESAILAVGSAKQVPVVVDEVVKVGYRMKATLSADHRVSDGAEAAQFLQALGEYLEHPLRLLI